MIALIVSKPGTPRGPLPYAFDLAGLDTREVLSVGQADSLIRLLGSRNCGVVIEAESLSQAQGIGTWLAFLRSRPELPAIVTACAHTNDSIHDLVAQENRILLEDPFDAAVVVAAARRVCDLARGETVSTCCSR